MPTHTHLVRVIQTHQRLQIDCDVLEVQVRGQVPWLPCDIICYQSQIRQPLWRRCPLIKQHCHVHCKELKSEQSIQKYFEEWKITAGQLTSYQFFPVFLERRSILLLRKNSNSEVCRWIVTHTSKEISSKPQFKVRKRDRVWPTSSTDASTDALK